MHIIYDLYGSIVLQLVVVVAMLHIAVVAVVAIGSSGSNR